MRLRGLVIALTFITLVVMQPWVCAVQTDAVQVDFQADPLFQNVNDPINIEDPNNVDTTIGEWRADLGEDMPNGTYYGTLFPPSKFKSLFPPSWWPTDDDAEFGQFTYVTLSAHFNLTQQQIMSGSSEWWVRAPFDPVCIEASAGLIVSIFNDETDPDEVTLYSGWNNQGTGRYQENHAARPTISGNVPDSYVVVSPMGWEWWSETTGAPMTDFMNQDMFRMVNDHAYIRMDAPLMPSRDYVLTFTFRLPPSVNLLTYWSTSEQPTGNTSVLATYEVLITEDGDVAVLDRVTSPCGLDLDFSFVFVEGIGYGGMFGKKIQVRQGTSMVLFPFLNTSRSGSQYPSFCLPFISKDGVEVHPQIHQGSGSSPGDSIHTWYFNAAGGEGPWYRYYFNPYDIVSSSLIWRANKGNFSVTVADASSFYPGMRIVIDDDDSPAETRIISFIDGDEIWFEPSLSKPMEVAENAIVNGYNDTYYEYRDFILFSSNRTLDWTSFDADDRWNVAVYYSFNNTANITLLCHVSDRPPITWAQLDDSRWNSSLSPWGRPSVGDNDVMPNSRGMIAWMNYDVWNSARGTSGQWAMVSTDSTGLNTYNYHFPQRIELSTAQWTIRNDTEKKEYTFQETWASAQEAWADRDYARAVYLGLSTGIDFIRDAKNYALGHITDSLRSAWDYIKGGFEILSTRLLEFVGWIKDVIRDAIDTILGFWASFKYMVAPMIMIFLIGVTSKVAAMIFMGREKGVRA